jgi:acyl-CoA reductase-like NAD-dependent aldehyde dehydrogenase
MMKIYREEAFGQLVVVASFTAEREALEMANDTIYRLGRSEPRTSLERMGLLKESRLS